MEHHKALPIGVTSFETMIDDNFIYVDKTDLIAKLAQDGYPCFLARPSLFGKTTLVNTFHELFAHGLERFKGLKIEKDSLYTDDKTYKVVHLDFSDFTSGDDIDKYLIHKLAQEFKRNAIAFDEQENFPSRFLRGTIKQEANKSIVVLIDNYDAPLNSVLNHPKKFTRISNALGSFYAGLKMVSNHLRFIFITGTARYDSLFHNCNILLDLSLNSKYGALLGFTQGELDFYFKDYIEEAACELNRANDNEQYSYESVLQLLKQHYGAYCFDEQFLTSVYNPWSVLKFLDAPDKGFKNYWRKSGTTTSKVLVKYLEQQVNSGLVSERFLNPDLTIDIEADGLVINILSHDFQNLSFAAQLYQTGFLSIKSCDADDLTLGIPNLEVRQAYSSIIIRLYKNIH